jgi:ElaB/YqjD/DUF883 family membrane-anchored ribosome-binding protein
MIDDETDTLPDGTDTVIAGASKVDDGATLETEDTGVSTEVETTDTTSSRSGGLGERIRSGRDQLSGQAGEKARGLVTQGLERTAEALANVSKMVGDTAPGIEERLGAEYGDYARRAAGAIESAANSIADKDPDELIDDTRNFVRNSPGVALAGAAVVGFVVARLFKTGLARSEDEG